MAKATNRLTDLQIAFNGFKARINSLDAPHDCGAAATMDDLLAYHAHLQEILNAALVYSRAVIANVSEVTSTTLTNNTDYLSDAIADVTGPLMKAAYRAEQGRAA